MNADLSVVKMILDASFVVQLVMLMLLGASFASWVVIFNKRRIMAQARYAADAFEQRFWSGGDLTTLFKEISAAEGERVGMEAIFESGFREFARLRKQPGVDVNQMVDAARRGMHIARLRELDRLESNLAFLATVGSTSPYVGLFGTVWGIMNSFHALGQVQQATMAMIAPGISEALVATAMGLFAAIPAVIAYNRYADRVERLETRFDTFMEEFAAILQRSGQPKAA